MSARSAIASRAGAGPEHADHAGLGHTRVHLVEAEAAQLVGDEGGGAPLLETELGMRVQIAAPGRHLVLEIADPVDDRHGLRPPPRSAAPGPA